MIDALKVIVSKIITWLNMQLLHFDQNLIVWFKTTKFSYFGKISKYKSVGCSGLYILRGEIGHVNIRIITFPMLITVYSIQS